MTEKQHSDNSSTSTWTPPLVVNSLATLDFQLHKSGYAIDYYEDGSFLSVRYVKGKCEGNGFLIKDNVMMRLIQFDNGKVINSQVLEPIRDIASVDSGERFEGLVFKGIPCGIGTYYDEENRLMYSGLMINWKREGFGISYNESGKKEYEGSWCYDRYHGEGSVFDLQGNVITKGTWIKGRLENSPDLFRIESVHRISQVSCFIKRLSIYGCNRSGFRILDVSDLIYLEILDVSGCRNVTLFRAVGLKYLKKIEMHREALYGGENSCSVFHDSYPRHEEFKSEVKGSDEEVYDREEWSDDTPLSLEKSVIVGDCPLLKELVMLDKVCSHFSILKLWSMY